jgi:predicted secreted protein
MAETGLAVRTEADARNGQRNGHGPAATAAARRRAVPGGRAVLGGLLVAAAVVGLFYASTRTQAPPRQTYVVARRAIAPGTRLGRDDLGRIAIDLPPAVAARAFHDPDTVVGATAIAPLAAGELVQASAVVAKPSAPASREVTFAVPKTTVSSSLEEGERIDIVATYGTGSDAFSTVVLRQALVVGLDRGRDSVGSDSDVSVTVAVDDATDTVALAHAVQLAKLTVVRATGATPVPGTPPVYRQPGAKG